MKPITRDRIALLAGEIMAPPESANADAIIHIIDIDAALQQLRAEGFF